MIQCTVDDAVTDWVIDYPMTEAVFQRLGIDHSCGGKSLKYACLTLGLDPQEVLTILSDLIEQQTNSKDDSMIV